VRLLVQVGGGGYLLSLSFYFLLFVGAPATVAFHVVDMMYDEEDLLKKIASECKGLSSEMTALYGYPHFSGIFIDLAEIYLQQAQAEFTDLKNTASAINPIGGKKLDSLLNHHMSRTSVWKSGNAVKSADEAEYKKKCEKLDETIKISEASVGDLQKKASKKYK